jgi:hypothetical protein
MVIAVLVGDRPVSTGNSLDMEAASFARGHDEGT